ncbi:MAG: class I SAM-dependent methyltransferase [Pirellulaceae bacterium]
MPLFALLLLGCDAGEITSNAGSNASTAGSTIDPNNASRRDTEDPQSLLTEPPPIKVWGDVVDFDVEIAVFETVFWEPEDTTSLRRLIRESPLVKDKTILEIGAGSGLVSLCCLERGAERVVATDINRDAVANARLNAVRLHLDEHFDVRQVPLDNPSAYSVIGDDEQFDLIISNPPWEDDQPITIDQYALYDRDFALLRSLLKDARRHLRPGGKILLAYGCVDAIRQVQRLGEQYDYEVRILDDRQLDDLEPVFLPGMLLELTPRSL